MAAVGLKRRVLGLAVLHVVVLRRCWDWRGSHISADWQLVRHIGEAKLKARKTLAELDEPLEELHKRLIGHLSQAELKELIRLLEKARAGLVDDA